MNKTNAKNTTTKLLALVVTLGVSATAMAERPSEHLYEQQESIAYGKVMSVTPIYREIKRSTPVKECWKEPVTRTRPARHHGNTAGSTLAGGLIGGIIGHQIGDGRGKKLATAVGTIVGAQIGHDAARGAHGSSHTTYTAYEDICEVENKVTYEEVLDSYRVSYKYKGNRYQSIMPYDPGKKIKLRVSVEPVI